MTGKSVCLHIYTSKIHIWHLIFPLQLPEQLHWGRRSSGHCRGPAVQPQTSVSEVSSVLLLQSVFMFYFCCVVNCAVTINSLNVWILNFWVCYLIRVLSACGRIQLEQEEPRRSQKHWRQTELLQSWCNHLKYFLSLILKVKLFIY